MKLFATIALAAMAVPAQAGCLSPEQFSEQITPGAIVGAAYYRGAWTDTTIMVETSNAIVAYGFKGGCMVSAVVVEMKGLPKPPAAAKPKVGVAA